MSVPEGFFQAIGGSVQRAPWGWVLTATVLVALIKAWPALAKTAADARDKLRGEKRDDLQSCNKKLADTNARVSVLEGKIAHFEVRLMAALSAFHLVDVDLASHDPEATSRVQARVLLKTAFHVDTAHTDIAAILDEIDLSTATH